uniref:Uncharacterized protein n=1 Tax=Sus scrofa TaxID=9823 RepID=A0A8D1PAL1_PIG
MDTIPIHFRCTTVWSLSSPLDGFEEFGPDGHRTKVTAFSDIPDQDNLPPLTCLEESTFSDSIFKPQIIARGLLDLSRDFSNNEEDFLTVLEIPSRLSEDPTVRAELMEQVAPSAIFLRGADQVFPVVPPIPVVVQWLTNPTRNHEVAGSIPEVLLVLLEQDLIFQHDVENTVCPRRDPGFLGVCRLASVLSKGRAERLLLPGFCELCADGKLFHVRKVCATNFGGICRAVGPEATEKFLVCELFVLCWDSVWGLPRACAESFVAVSRDASSEVPGDQTWPIPRSPCRSLWFQVLQAAFQARGPFISTFANPSRAGPYIRGDGTLRPRAPDLDSGFTPASPSRGSGGSASSAGKPEQAEPHPPVEDTSSDTGTSLYVSSSSGGRIENPGADSVLAGAQLTRLCPEATKPPGPTESPEDVLSNFPFGRAPLPDISKDLELLLREAGPGPEDCSPPETVQRGCVAKGEIQRVLEKQQEHMMHDSEVQAQVWVLPAALRATQLDSVREPERQPAGGPNGVSVADPSPAPRPAAARVGFWVAQPGLQGRGPGQPCRGASDHREAGQRRDAAPLEENKSKLQDRAPHPLPHHRQYDQYVSTTDPARAQTVDTDTAKHCASSLPAVALALGRPHWHSLKDTYETLASDVQRKVRRTLAFSVHEPAVILGNQLTAADRVPIFNGFLKDLDAVRTGVLRHLCAFLKSLHEDKRRECLYQLQAFAVTHNSRNWRFPCDLAEDLILILELCNSNDVYDFLMQIPLKLCADKVSEVRWLSFKLVVAILQKFRSNSESALGLNFIKELMLRFGHCSKWVGRQAWAFMCQAAVSKEGIPVGQVAERFLPSPLRLAADPVPNAGVPLAKTLKQTLLEKAYFRNAGNPHLEVVEETVLALQSDRDQDVNSFATLEPEQQTVTDTAVLETRNQPLRSHTVRSIHAWRLWLDRVEGDLKVPRLPGEEGFLKLW